jgi:SAM-dependent methyltransferase
LEAAAVASKNILKFDGKFHSMKKWVIKAIVQKIISFLPYKYHINYLFQKYITRGVQLSDDYLEDRLIHYANHQKAFLSFEKKLAGKKIGELGTGWYPVIPICFYLNGASEIVTMDIAPLMDKEKAIQTILKLQQYAKRDRLRDFITYSEEKLDELVDFVQNTSFSFEELLQKMKITYRLGDAAQMDLKRASYDLIVSNNTFEHVYPDDLKTLLQKFKKLLKPGGVMSHFIDMSDHFAHLDKTITIYNFLRFSEPQWARIDNTIQPQNRWRIYQYRELYEQLGIPIQQEINRPGNLADLRSVQLADDFLGEKEEELAISHSYLISKI